MLRITLIVALIGLASCGDDRCASDPSGGDSAPVIEQFDLLGQLEGDPWTLVFGVSFTDSNADLAAGHAEFSLNGALSGSQLRLDEIFRQSGVPATSKSGRIAFPLRFSDTVQDGAEVWLGLQLLDGETQRSNCTAMKLHFAVEPVAAWLHDLRDRVATWMGLSHEDST